MFSSRVSLWIRALLVMFFVGTALELVTTEAEARAGRGRSMGRSSSYGPRSQPPANNYNSPSPAGSPAMNNRGGFLRGMAGGIAGGFLGSMLFSSLGHAAGGVGGAGGGGIGLIEIALLAGLAYFGFRWWKSRQQTANAFGGMAPRTSVQDLSPNAADRMEGMNDGHYPALAPAGIESDTASDIFFKIQGAWTRRDLSSVQNLLEADMQRTFENDLTELKQNQQINRLENISVRGTDVTHSWREGDHEYSTVRFSANLLDYTVDEKTGKVVTGSDTSPVKFEEDWTFTKAARAGSWQLAGIQQV